MTNQAFIDLVRANLSQLTWPGDEHNKPCPLPLPMFDMAKMPPDMAAHYANQAGLPSADTALLVAQALDALLSTNGLTVIPAAELAQLHAAAQATETTRNRRITLACNCGNKLCSLTIRDYGTDNPKVNGHGLIEAMAQLDADCSTGHERIEK